MADVTLKKASDIDSCKRPNAIEGICFRCAARDFGVAAWGMNVLEMEPNRSGHPEHDHGHDGQEEVYLVLRGSVILLTENCAKLSLEPNTLVRVGPEVKRKFVAGSDGATILAIGGTPGIAYKAYPVGSGGTKC